MKVHADCFPCFLKQSVIALNHGTQHAGLREKILKAVLADIKRTDTRKPPAYTTTFIHRRIRRMLGKDPFRGIKTKFNRISLGLYPQLKRVVRKSGDPLGTAARLAIAGNIIDFGIFTSVDIEATIERALQAPLAVDHSRSFRKALAKTADVLYLLDNAGEVVFDRLLIETLLQQGRNVVAVVKGSAVLNDCTMLDAREAGVTDICEVIDNGSDGVGTIFEWTSRDFRKRYKQFPVIISKGQGNFETLKDPEKTIFYLFQSKCEVVSNELGLSRCSMVLKKS